jgi:hypothetical protein
MMLLTPASAPFSLGSASEDAGEREVKISNEELGVFVMD